jgi:hypothetical protein
MTNKGRKMKLKWIILPAVIIAVTITMLHSKKNTDIPKDLIGEWITSAPGYQDYFFKLTKEQIIYGHYGDKQDVYIISSLEKNQEGKDIVYTINYKSTDVKFTRYFFYVPENGGTIQFKHQEHIKWRKLKDVDFKENSETDQNKKAGQNEKNS